MLYLVLPAVLVPVLAVPAAVQNLASVQVADQPDGHTLAEAAEVAIVGVRVVHLQTRDRQACTGVER
jgi:hypothetical protein